MTYLDLLLVFFAGLALGLSLGRWLGYRIGHVDGRLEYGKELLKRLDEVKKERQ